MESPVLQVRDLHFSYGAVQVLAGASFEVAAGETVAVVGSNGAGKTTLLRVLSGLEQATRGSVRLGAADVTWASPRQRVQRGLITLFAGPDSVFGPMTVEENLRVASYPIWSRPQMMADRLDEVYDVFPKLSQLRRSFAVNLSGGEKQMLTLARAVLLRPRMLCVDELSLGLAPVLVEQLLGTLRSFSQMGVATLLVEQSADVAEQVTSRVLQLRRGKILASPGPDHSSIVGANGRSAQHRPEDVKERAPAAAGGRGR